MFREDPPDLVVLDLMLPGMDGREVCSAIRADSTVPIVMLTARDTELDKVALLEAGADDYVVKPFSPPELVARVRELCFAGPAVRAVRGHAGRRRRAHRGGRARDPPRRARSHRGRCGR